MYFYKVVAICWMNASSYLSVTKIMHHEFDYLCIKHIQHFFQLYEIVFFEDNLDVIYAIQDRVWIRL